MTAFLKFRIRNIKEVDWNLLRTLCATGPRFDGDAQPSYICTERDEVKAYMVGKDHLGARARQEVCHKRLTKLADDLRMS